MPTGSILENAGGVTDVVCANDCSNLGSTDFDCDRMGVKGGVDAIIVDEVEALCCLEEWGCGDSKFAVDIESSVDTESRLSNTSEGPLSPPDIGFTWVTLKRACGGFEPKT